MYDIAYHFFKLLHYNSYQPLLGCLLLRFTGIKIVINIFDIATINCQ